MKARNKIKTEKENVKYSERTCCGLLHQIRPTVLEGYKMEQNPTLNRYNIIETAKIEYKRLLGGTF